MTANDPLHVIASEQAGLFTRAQALRCGFTAFQIRRRLQAGEWRRVVGPVLCVRGTQIRPAVRDRAAQLAFPGGALARPSAARRHGVPTRDPRSYLAVGPASHPRLDGVRLFRDPVAPDDLEMVAGVLITTRERTVFDCLRVAPDAEAVNLLDRALQAGWLTPEALAARVHRFAGRRGADRLARLSRLAGSGAAFGRRAGGCRAGPPGWADRVARQRGAVRRVRLDRRR